MEFEMNKSKWVIREVPAKEIKMIYEEISGEETEFVYGYTHYGYQVIFINEDICRNKKKHTLKHELMHCYINEYISMGIEIDEEMLCNISANSHDIIHEIVEEYFKIDK